MGDFGDQVDQHLESFGHIYYIILMTVQILYFIGFNIYVSLIGEYKETHFQIYKLFSISLMFLSMGYFLSISIRRKSPIDLFTFIIMSTICTFYLLFRDVLYYFYPDYYLIMTATD